jgi:hypothetical protein
MHTMERTFLAVITCLFCCDILLAEQANILASGNVSRPAGVVVLVVPGNSQAILSVPFDPYDSRLSAVFQGQLAAATGDANGDLVRFWDAGSNCYRTYEKNVSGEWRLVLTTSDETNAVAVAQAEPTIGPGVAFAVANNRMAPQTLMFGGSVVLDSDRLVSLAGVASLVSYPFTTARPATETSIGKTGGTLTGNAFEMAAGYWHIMTNAARTDWIETPPYENLFPKESAVRIAGMSCAVANSEVTLKIEVAKGIGKADVFKRDMARSDRLDNWGGWTLAATDLPVEAGQPGTWTDRTLRTDPAFKGVRLYVAARSDAATDLDADGIPDARKWLCGSGADAVPQTREATVAGSASSDVVFPGMRVGAVTGTTNTPARGANPLLWGSVIHISVLRGDDTCSGLAPSIVEGSQRRFPSDGPGIPDGPTRTIKAGLRAFDRESRVSGEAPGRQCLVVVHEGSYGENLNVAGRSAHVVFQGRVDLSGKPAMRGADGASRSNMAERVNSNTATNTPCR